MIRARFTGACFSWSRSRSRRWRSWRLSASRRVEVDVVPAAGARPARPEATRPAATSRVSRDLLAQTLDHLRVLPDGGDHLAPVVCRGALPTSATNSNTCAALLPAPPLPTIGSNAIGPAMPCCNSKAPTKAVPRVWPTDLSLPVRQYVAFPRSRSPFTRLGRLLGKMGKWRKIRGEIEKEG
jgi:hypothetical protein